MPYKLKLDDEFLPPEELNNDAFSSAIGALMQRPAESSTAGTAVPREGVYVPPDKIDYAPMVENYVDLLEEQPAERTKFKQDYADLLQKYRSARPDYNQISQRRQASGVAGMLYNMLATNPNTFEMMGQTYHTGPDPSAWSRMGNAVSSAIMSPLEAQREYRNDLKDDLGMTVNGRALDRQEVDNMGKDLGSLLSSGKSLESIQNDRAKNDPGSPVSSMYRDSFIKNVTRIRDNLFKGSQFKTYQKFVPYLDSKISEANGASAAKIEKLESELQKDFAMPKAMVDEETKLRAAELQAFATRNGANDKSFGQREKLDKIQSLMLTNQKLTSMWTQIAEMSKDPEIRTGFGGQALNRLAAQFNVNDPRLTRKQAQFVSLIQAVVGPDRHLNYGANLTGNEEKLANAGWPTENDVVDAISGKVITNVKQKRQELKDLVYRHNNLRTGKPFEHALNDEEANSYVNQIFVSPQDDDNQILPAADDYTAGVPHMNSSNGVSKKTVRSETGHSALADDSLQKYADDHFNGDLAAAKRFLGK